MDINTRDGLKNKLYFMVKYSYNYMVFVIIFYV